MLTSRRLVLVIPLLALLALALPSTASAQATRTWVSGVGDDANPCSRTAPCKTWAGAISKTAAGGEMNAIDPGGFGGVTITKSIRINGHGVLAGSLVSGTNAIVVNAAATDKVVIKNLDINGIGTGAQTSLTGVKVLAAKKVKIKNNDIYRFKAGIAVVPSTANTKVVISDNDIDDNGIGVIAAPAAGGDGARVILRRNEITDNTCGVSLTSHGANASTPDANNQCGTSAFTGFQRPVTVSAFRNLIADNGNGVFARGVNSVAEVGANEILGNDTAGLRATAGSTIRSFGNNHISGNGPSSTAPTETVTTG